MSKRNCFIDVFTAVGGKKVKKSTVNLHHVHMYSYFPFNLCVEACQGRVSF